MTVNSLHFTFAPLLPYTINSAGQCLSTVVFFAYSYSHIGINTLLHFVGV